SMVTGHPFRSGCRWRPRSPLSRRRASSTRKPSPSPWLSKNSNESWSYKRKGPRGLPDRAALFVCNARQKLLIQAQLTVGLGAQPGAARLQPFLQPAALWLAAGGILIDAGAPVPIAFSLIGPQRAVLADQPVAAVIARQGQPGVAAGPRESQSQVGQAARGIRIR